MLEECGGLERTDIAVYILYGRVWWSWMDWFFTVSYFESGCGGLERTDFLQFLWGKSVMVLKELIFYSFYVGRVWWSWKNWFLTVSTLGGCGGLERNDFLQFIFWVDVVVLERTDFLDCFFFGWMWWSWKNWFLTVYMLEGCGGLQWIDFLAVSTLRKVWLSWKNWFLTVHLCWKWMWWSWKN